LAEFTEFSGSLPKILSVSAEMKADLSSFFSSLKTALYTDWVAMGIMDNLKATLCEFAGLPTLPHRQRYIVNSSSSESMAIKGFNDGSVCCYFMTGDPLLKLPEVFVLECSFMDSFVCSFFECGIITVSMDGIEFTRSFVHGWVDGWIECISERGFLVFE
jgi:hypothetical protein